MDTTDNALLNATQMSPNKTRGPINLNDTDMELNFALEKMKNKRSVDIVKTSLLDEVEIKKAKLEIKTSQDDSVLGGTIMFDQSIVREETAESVQTGQNIPTPKSTQSDLNQATASYMNDSGVSESFRAKERTSIKKNNQLAKDRLK